LSKPWVRETLTLNLILNHHINPMLILTSCFFKYPFYFYLLTYVLHREEFFLRSWPFLS